MSRYKIKRVVNNQAIRKAFNGAFVIVEIFNFQGDKISKNPFEVNEYLVQYVNQMFQNANIALIVAPDWEIPPPEKTGAL